MPPAVLAELPAGADPIGSLLIGGVLVTILGIWSMNAVIVTYPQPRPIPWRRFAALFLVCVAFLP